MRSRFYIFGCLYSISFALGTVLSKFALNEGTPLFLFFTQLLGSTLVLWIVSCIRKVQPKDLSSVAKMGYAGILEPGLAYTLGTVGLMMISASIASFIGSLEVILTVFLSALILKESLGLKKVLLCMTSFIGILLVISPWNEGVGKSTFIGYILYFSGVLMAVIYAILSKKQVKDIPPLSLLTSQLTLGLACITVILLISLVTGITKEQLHNNFLFYLLAFSSGILQYCIPYSLYLVVLKNTDVSNIAFYIGLVPVFTLFFSVMLLGESFTWVQASGGVIVLFSVLFVKVHRSF